MNGKCVVIFFLCFFYPYIIISCLYNFHHTFSEFLSFISWVFHLFVFFTTLTVTFSLRLFCVFRDLFLYLPFAFEIKSSYIWYFKSSQEICNEKIYLYCGEDFISNLWPLLWYIISLTIKGVTWTICCMK